MVACSCLCTITCTTYYFIPAGLHHPHLPADAGGDTSVLDRVRAFQAQVERLRCLRPDAAEYACLKAIVLFGSGAFCDSFDLHSFHSYVPFDSFDSYGYGRLVGAASGGKLDASDPLVSGLIRAPIERECMYTNERVSEGPL